MKKSDKSEKIDLNFASLCFASKQKLLNRSEAKNLRRKKAGKSEKNGIKAGKKRKKVKKAKKKRKKAKKSLEFRFALFHFEAKTTKVKRSEKFEAKRCEKKRKKRSEIL